MDETGFRPGFQSRRTAALERTFTTLTAERPDVDHARKRQRPPVIAPVPRHRGSEDVLTPPLPPDHYRRSKSLQSLNEGTPSTTVATPLPATPPIKTLRASQSIRLGSTSRGARRLNRLESGRPPMESLPSFSRLPTESRLTARAAQAGLRRLESSRNREQAEGRAQTNSLAVAGEYTQLKITFDLDYSKDVTSSSGGSRRPFQRNLSSPLTARSSQGTADTSTVNVKTPKVENNKGESIDMNEALLHLRRYLDPAISNVGFELTFPAKESTDGWLGTINCGKVPPSSMVSSAPDAASVYGMSLASLQSGAFGSGRRRSEASTNIEVRLGNSLREIRLTNREWVYAIGVRNGTCHLLALDLGGLYWACYWTFLYNQKRLKHEGRQNGFWPAMSVTFNFNDKVNKKQFLWLCHDNCELPTCGAALKPLVKLSQKDLRSPPKKGYIRQDLTFSISSFKLFWAETIGFKNSYISVNKFFQGFHKHVLKQAEERKAEMKRQGLSVTSPCTDRPVFEKLWCRDTPKAWNARLRSNVYIYENGLELNSVALCVSDIKDALVSRQSPAVPPQGNVELLDLNRFLSAQ